MALTDRTIKKFTRGLLILAGSAISLYAAYFFWDIILILIISVLLGMIFNPVVNLIERQGFNRILSVIIVFIGVGILFFLGLSFFIPMIIDQVNTLAVSLSQESVANFMGQIAANIKTYLPFLDTKEFATQLSQGFSGLFLNSIDNVSNIVSGIFSVVSITILVPFITFFLLKDHTEISKGIINLMPNKYFEMSYSVLQKINFKLGRYVRSWILDAAFVAVLSAIGLSILGIKNAVIIGIIAGIGHLIPFFGPIIGGLPAIIISLIQFGDFSMLLPIVIMFVIIYTFDNGFVQPNVFAKSTDLHPLMIILLIIAGSKLMGAVGMLLAVPVATVCRTAVREIYFGFKHYKIIKL